MFDDWIDALEARHLQDLSFPEVSRALRALSSTYVERRQRLGEGAALAGAGKRAAFALFYGPLHFLLVREIATRLGATAVTRIVDLGCGTGASGAAWSSICTPRPALVGLDRHPWALKEAGWTYWHFGLRARTTQGDIGRVPLPRERSAFLAAFALNELSPEGRDTLVERLLARHAEGDPVLIVEPIAGSAAPWWGALRTRVEAAGGRADEWRVSADLPPIVAKLDRAAGLDHRQLTGRSLWLA